MDKIENTLQAGTLLQGNYSYRILSVLGQGSFGITYKAEIRVVGPLGELPGEKTKVAIKEYFLRECNSREKSGFIQESSDNSLVKRYREKFITEARNLSRMKKSPDIVSVVEDFSANNTHYYVMEYIEGCNLDEYIHIRGGLSEDEALGCICQIGKALIYMHAHGMLHLDLKPKNVMRRNDGTLVLIDFGLSKQYEKNGEPESSTTVGLGTPGYAPVEQATGAFMGKDGKIPYTLDVYALGATLYKLLVAETPPHSSELINMDFPETKLTERRVSQRTISAIKTAMSPRVCDRPQEVGYFLQLLVAEKKDIQEETILEDVTPKDNKNENDDKGKDKNRIYKFILAMLFLGLAGWIWLNWPEKEKLDIISSEVQNAIQEREHYMKKASTYWMAARLGTKNSNGRMNDSIADSYWNMLSAYHSVDSLDLLYKQKKGWKSHRIDRLQVDDIKSKLSSYYKKNIEKEKYITRIEYLTDRSVAYTDSSFYYDSLRYVKLMSIELKYLIYQYSVGDVDSLVVLKEYFENMEEEYEKVRDNTFRSNLRGKILGFDLQFHHLIDEAFKAWVLAGDKAVIPQMKVSNYETALRLKKDPRIEKKVEQIKFK